MKAVQYLPFLRELRQQAIDKKVKNATEIKDALLEFHRTDNKNITTAELGDVIDRITSTWPMFTGIYNYPVPHETLEPIRAFGTATVETLWHEGQYAENRRALLDHIVKSLEEKWDSSIFYDAAKVIYEMTFQKGSGYWQQHEKKNDIQHYWHGETQSRYELHETVAQILAEGVRPLDWQQLLLEWPTVFENLTKVSFTRNERQGQKRQETKTTLGRYLKRHWPDLPDHRIRDLVAVADPGQLRIINTTEEILEAIKSGPYTCMADVFNIPHPYTAYDPKYGWSLAVRVKEGRVLGRALLLAHEGKNVYVRSYTEVREGKSETDHALEVMLTGHTKVCEWPEGAKLAKVTAPPHFATDYILPFLDGYNELVEDYIDCFKISREGNLKCSQTNGSYEDTYEDYEDDYIDDYEDDYEDDDYE